MSTMGLHCRFAWAAQCCIVTSWVPPVTLWVPPALLQLPPYCSVSPPVFSPGSCPVSSASQQLSEPGYPTSLSCRAVPLRWPRASSSCCPLDHRMWYNCLLSPSFPTQPSQPPVLRTPRAPPPPAGVHRAGAQGADCFLLGFVSSSVLWAPVSTLRESTLDLKGSEVGCSGRAWGRCVLGSGRVKASRELRSSARAPLRLPDASLTP